MTPSLVWRLERVLEDSNFLSDKLAHVLEAKKISLSRQKFAKQQFDYAQEIATSVVCKRCKLCT